MRASVDDASERRTRIEADLARLGVAEEARDELAHRLVAVEPQLSREAYEAALAGVALAHRVHREGEEVLRKSTKDLLEIQRLLGAFADEMRKLDEALQILATYVQRMRTQVPTAERRTVH